MSFLELMQKIKSNVTAYIQMVLQWFLRAYQIISQRLIHYYKIIFQWLMNHCAQPFKQLIAPITRFCQMILRIINRTYQRITQFFSEKIQNLIQVIARWLTPLANVVKSNARFWWNKIRELKIKNETIGDIIDTKIALINSYAWVKQLKEASQYNTRVPTLVSTCFANILALIFPLALMQVYDRIIPNHTLSTLIFLTIGVIVAFAVEGVLRVIRVYINLWADTKYEYSLGKTAFNKLINAPLYISENIDVGTRLKQFAILDQMKGFYNTQLLTATYEVPFLFIFLFAIAYLGGWLFFIPFIITVLVVYVSWRFAKHWEHLLEKKVTFEARESDFIINVLTGIHTAKSIGMEELLIRRHERLQESGMQVNFLSSLHDGDLLTIKTIASQLIIVLTASVGSIMVIQGNLAIGGLAACILLAGRVMRPFDRVLSAFNRLSMITIVRKKLDPIFELPSDINPAATEVDVAQGEITLCNVGYHFDNYADHPILKNINLQIPPHTLVAITGRNQTEKTALLNILATIVKPTTGEYLLDNKNENLYQSVTLRKQIAYLNRTGKLFRGTIMDNLSAFNEQLVPTARRLVDRLGLNTILSRLPSGYDTFVGEKAVEALPGGVLNLIFIIRALVSKPKIVLFDETNINLDTQSNKHMLDLLVYLKEFSTVVVLASNQSTIDLVDVVYAFQDEKLIRVNRAE